jgi:hypothetical protein
VADQDVKAAETRRKPVRALDANRCRASSELTPDERETPMTTTTTATYQQRRPVLPLLSLLVAGAAATIAVVAIATDDTGGSPQQIVVDERLPGATPSGAAAVDADTARPRVVIDNRDACGRRVMPGALRCD